MSNQRQAEQTGQAGQADDRHIEPVLGINDDDLGVIDELSAATEDIVEGGLASVDVMIAGVEFIPGGEERTGNDGQPYTAPDTIALSMKVLNVDGIDFTTDWLNLPKSTISRTGQAIRSKITTSSKLGIFVSTWEGLGVSSNPDLATMILVSRGLGAMLRDLIGLCWHKERQNFDGYNNSSIAVSVPTEIYGYDNEFRASLELEPKYVKGQEPAPIQPPRQQQQQQPRQAQAQARTAAPPAAAGQAGQATRGQQTQRQATPRNQQPPATNQAATQGRLPAATVQNLPAAAQSTNGQQEPHSLLPAEAAALGLLGGDGLSIEEFIKAAISNPLVRRDAAVMTKIQNLTFLDEMVKLGYVVEETGIFTLGQ